MPATTPTTSTKKANLPPPWARELMEKFSAGISHCFFLHGNVQDYPAIPGQGLRHFLVSSLGNRDIIVLYNRAGGFSFPVPAHKRKFMEIVFGEIATTTRGGGMAGGLNGASAATPDEKLEHMGRQPLLALAGLTKLLHATESNGQPLKVAVLLEYGETLCPNGGDNGITSEADRTAYVTMAEWATDPIIAESNKLILMVVAEKQNLNEKLIKSGSRWEPIELPFPTLNGRARFAKKLLEQKEVSYSPLAEGFCYEDLARLTNGLRCIDLEDIVLRATYREEPISRELVNDVKKDIVKSEFDEILEIVEPSVGFEALGGLVEIKNALRLNVIEPMRSGKHRIVPQGILLMGPPGTGKSRIAMALAAEAQFSFVVLNPAKIFDKYVGSTENRLEKAITAIKSMSPVVVFIDELDQTVQRGAGGDSGTSNRVFKRLMEVMADSSWRGKILWLGATNRPDLLDAALLRPGRFDEKIPVLAPDALERANILEILVSQIFKGVENSTTVAEYAKLANQMEGYTGAEIELVVSKALKVHTRSDGTISIFEALERAYDLIIPTTDIAGMTEVALQYCSDLDLVPEKYQAQARQLRTQKKRESSETTEPVAQPTNGDRKPRDW